MELLDDVVLRDGSTLRLRPPVAADAAALLSFFERLSPVSRYLRFHGVRRVEPSLVAPVLDPDWVERGALETAARYLTDRVWKRRGARSGMWV